MTSITVRRLSSQRNKEAGDWKAVYDLCCRTGNNGQPIVPERWDLFGRLWVGPYEEIFPQWTYVAEAGGVVVGYLTGCPNSHRFAKAKLGALRCLSSSISAAAATRETGALAGS